MYAEREDCTWNSNLFDTWTNRDNTRHESTVVAVVAIVVVLVNFNRRTQKRLRLFSAEYLRRKGGGVAHGATMPKKLRVVWGLGALELYASLKLIRAHSAYIHINAFDTTRRVMGVITIEHPWFITPKRVIYLLNFSADTRVCSKHAYKTISITVVVMVCVVFLWRLGGVEYDTVIGYLFNGSSEPLFSCVSSKSFMLRAVAYQIIQIYVIWERINCLHVCKRIQFYAYTYLFAEETERRQTKKTMKKEKTAPFTAVAARETSRSYDQTLRPFNTNTLEKFAYYAAHNGYL